MLCCQEGCGKDCSPFAAEILWAMAQQSKGTDADPLALVVAIPTCLHFTLQVGETETEQTWCNGSCLSWTLAMPREFLFARPGVGLSTTNL